MNIKESYQKHKNELFHYLISITKNPDIAEDIVSTTFEKFLKNEDNIQNVRAWLYRVARNSAYDYFKKNNRLIPDNDFIGKKDFDQDSDEIDKKSLQKI